MDRVFFINLIIKSKGSKQLVARLFEFLVDLVRISVKLVSEGPLLVELERAKHFAQVAINHVFNRCVGAAENHVVAATQRLGFNPQIHLQMRKEVQFLFGFKRHERRQRTHRTCRVDEFPLAGGHLFERSLHLSSEVLTNVVKLRASSIQETRFPASARSSRVVVHVFLDAGRHPHDVEILELVDSRYRVFIK